MGLYIALLKGERIKRKNKG